MNRLEENLAKELSIISEKGLTRKVRSLRFITPTLGISEDKKEYIVFSSNNYLGLTHAKEVIKESQEAAKYGTGSSGSRLTTGTSFESNELEKALAKFKHSEKALVFNTGYMTNLGVLYGLGKKDDVIFSDSLNHASIIDGCKITKAQVKVYSHSNMKELEKLLDADNTRGQKFVVTDGVFSMDGDLAKLDELIMLKKKYDFCLIVDDAHGVGILGEDGSGTASFFGKIGEIDLQVGTLSKALASEGGYVAGKAIYIDYLINKARPFIFSTAISPIANAAALAALKLLVEDKDNYLYMLKENTQYLRNKLVEENIPIVQGLTPIIPIIIGAAKKTVLFAQKLEKRGFLVSAIRPPTVEEGKSRLRITVTAAHTKEQIDSLVLNIRDIWKEIMLR